MNASGTAKLKCPVLAIFGGADPVIPNDQVDQFADALAQSPVESELRIFADAGHAFVHRPQPDGQDNAQQAIEEILQWLPKYI